MPPFVFTKHGKRRENAMISTALAVLFTKNARIIKKSCRKIWWNKIFVVPLHSQFRNDCFHRANGVLTERLGNGLQNRVERFDSARHLAKRKSFQKKGFLFCFPYLPYRIPFTALSYSLDCPFWAFRIYCL